MKRFLMAALLTFTFVGMKAQAEDRMIMVNGVAERSLDPNMVQLEISVWSNATTAKQAQSLAAQMYKQVKKSFDEFKIKKEDIQTTGYSLSPSYEYDAKTQRNKLNGYQVTQSLSVIVRKVDETGNFLDSLITEKKGNESGVNVQSINWDSDKREQAATAALGDAVRATKTKAEEIAKAAGVKLKGVTKISHTTSDGGGPRPVFARMEMAKAADAPTEVSGGQVRVRVEVSAEYEIQ